MGPGLETGYKPGSNAEGDACPTPQRESYGRLIYRRASPGTSVKQEIQALPLLIPRFGIESTKKSADSIPLRTSAEEIGRLSAVQGWRASSDTTHGGRLVLEDSLDEWRTLPPAHSQSDSSVSCEFCLLDGRSRFI